MTIINYYLLQEEESPELQVFQSLHQQGVFKEHYQRLKGVPLVTNIYDLTKSSRPFKENSKVYAQMQATNNGCFPLVEIDGEIRKVQKYLTVAELAELLDIGLALQDEND